MPKNPLFSNRTSPNGATAPSNPLNDSYKRYRRGYNRFKLDRPFYNTERYADINVIDVVEGVEGDKLQFGNRHSIQSYTWKAPKMFELFKKKSYFMMDMKAILPENWEKIYKQPNKGDDVNDDVNCFSTDLIYKLFVYPISNCVGGKWMASASGIARDSIDNFFYSDDGLTFLFKYLFLCESFFSDGSLFSSMNCHLSNMVGFSESISSFSIVPEVSFDIEFDFLVSNLPFEDLRFEVNGVVVNPDDIQLSYNSLIDLLRSSSDFKVTSSTYDIVDSFLGFFSKMQFLSPDNSNSIYSLNYSRIVAYQLVAAQFFTRDSVDGIYNSQTYLDNQKSLFLDISRSSLISLDLNVSYQYWPQFEYNGTSYDYDVYSGFVLNRFGEYFVIWNNALGDDLGSDTLLSEFQKFYNFMYNFSFYRKNLRYGDYFNGAKTLPYSPADVTAEVKGDGVSAIDITRSILMQRFANAVERVSNTWNDYLKGVMDGVAPPDVEQPRFLASVTSSVDGFEVENTTSDDQGKRVTILKSGNSNYIYEIDCGSPCIVIGLSTYSIVNVYSKTVSPFWRMRDRFDMFNKFMQNVGDQNISQSERNAIFSPEKIFGYTPRHMEYKQRYPIASGGFVNFLPGYSFIIDNFESGNAIFELKDSDQKISPFYIRSRNFELDRFYASLTGYSLASYFHFQCRYENYVDARRQMEFSPAIL